MSQRPRSLQPDPFDAASQALADGFRQLAEALRAELHAAVAQLTPAVEPFNMLTIKQTCEFFGVSEPTLRQWERAGHLRPFRDGKVVLYDTRQIDAFVQRQQAESADEAAA